MESKMAPVLLANRALLQDWKTSLSPLVTEKPTENKCSWNCSGNGRCEDGQCVCLVQYTGGYCDLTNFGYYMTFGTIFIVLCVVVVVQLLMCVRSEYIKEERNSLKGACKITTQKMLYFLTVCATALRGSYFFSRWHVSEHVSLGLWTAYYPFLLTGFSLIVCFWAEAFHLSSFVGDKPRFLSKSVIWFAVFNISIYLMFLGQLIAVDVINDDRSSEMITRICYGCFAILIMIVVIIFLIYGIEVFFKVHGAFTETKYKIDTWQLHMSRTGLVAQAILQFITALFLASEALNHVWIDQLPILSQNLYDIGFRIAEFGVALWFPCVLWNCRSPEQLWVLNPKRIFKNIEIIGKENESLLRYRHTVREYGSIGEKDEYEYDCWICYDPQRLDAGPLIQPCSCTGDTATVHHNCLKKWLIECADNDKKFECNVCKEKYKLSAGWLWLPRGVEKRHWLQTFLALIVMTGCPLAAYAVTHSGTGKPILILSISLTMLIELVSLRILGSSLLSFYRHARMASVKIRGKEVKSNSKIETESDTTPAVTYTSDNQVFQRTVSQRQDQHSEQYTELNAGLLGNVDVMHPVNYSSTRGTLRQTNLHKLTPDPIGHSYISTHSEDVIVSDETKEKFSDVPSIRNHSDDDNLSQNSPVSCSCSDSDQNHRLICVEAIIEINR